MEVKQSCFNCKHRDEVDKLNPHADPFCCRTCRCTDESGNKKTNWEPRDVIEDINLEFEKLMAKIQPEPAIKPLTNKEAAIILKNMMRGATLRVGRANGKSLGTLRTYEAICKAIKVLDETPD